MQKYKKDLYLQTFTTIFQEKSSFLDEDSIKSSTFAGEMSTTIRHQGIIDTIEGRHLRIRIQQTSACAACKIQGHCNASESKEKIIDVYDDSAVCHYSEGQQVTVYASGTMATRALLLGFGLPLLLMLAVFFIATALGASQGLGAALMLGSLVPYYLTIWCVRHSIAQHIIFRIESQTTL